MSQEIIEAVREIEREKGIESGTLHFLSESSRVATIALFVVLVAAVAWLAVAVGRAKRLSG